MPSVITVCAHRGASGTHPENTVSAMRHAAELGCEMVEFDVRMTADKECVIFHDATVDRTTNGSGNIWDLTLAEVKALEVLATVPNQGKNRVASHDNSFRSRTPTGEKIPTFTELLDSLPSGLELNIHTYPGPDDHDETCAAVVEAILSRQLNAFVAGTFEVLETVSALSNGAVRLCLLSATSDRENYVPHCARLGCRIMQPNWSIVDKQLCEAAHAASIKVNPFWADEVEEMERQLDAGVDGMLTNYPAVLIQVLEQRGLRKRQSAAAL